MKTPLLYGSLMAVAGALITFGLYFTGFHDSPQKLQIAQWIAGIVGLAVAVVCMALAMRERRAEFPAHREWSYGSAFGTGFLTGLVSVLIGAVLGYIYFAVVNPQFSETVYQAQVAKMEQGGMSASQIDAAAGTMRKFMSPVALTIFQVLSGVIWSVVLALIVAIFYRRPVATTPLVDATLPPVA